MRHTTALLAVLLCAGAAVGCSSEKSYDDTVKDCVTALKERPADSKAKPEACDGVKDDDYTALLVSQNIDDLGWTDGEGNFDENKMVEDLLDDGE